MTTRNVFSKDWTAHEVCGAVTLCFPDGENPVMIKLQVPCWSSVLSVCVWASKRLERPKLAHWAMVVVAAEGFQEVSL